MEEIFNKTLAQMSVFFTSNEFCKKALKNGIPKSKINAGAARDFLLVNANRSDTKRTWTKRDENIQPPISGGAINEAIRLLKRNGYKIMKPVNDWVEI